MDFGGKIIVCFEEVDLAEFNNIYNKWIIKSLSKPFLRVTLEFIPLPFMQIYPSGPTAPRGTSA